MTETTTTLVGVWAGMMLGIIGAEATTKRQWGRAIDRTVFCSITLLAVAVCLWAK